MKGGGRVFKQEVVTQWVSAKVGLDEAKAVYDKATRALGDAFIPLAVKDETFIRHGDNEVLHVYRMPDGYKAKVCKLETV
jgi:hypothetical protein